MLNELNATHNDIPRQIRGPVIMLLNAQLAETFDLYSQLKQAHWNVKGHTFIQLHLLFDDIAGLVLGYADSIAERITALGGTAYGTVRMASSASELAEFPVHLNDGQQFVGILSERMGQYASRNRAHLERVLEYNDQLTADLLIEIGRTIEKQLWFLESHLN